MFCPQDLLVIWLKPQLVASSGGCASPLHLGGHLVTKDLLLLQVANCLSD